MKSFWRCAKNSQNCPDITVLNSFHGDIKEREVILVSNDFLPYQEQPNRKLISWCVSSVVLREGAVTKSTWKVTFHKQPTNKATNQPSTNQPTKPTKPTTIKQDRLQTTARWHQQNNRWRIWRFDSSFELSRYLTAVLAHQKIILRFWTWIWKSSQKTPTISSSLSSPYSSSSCRSKGKLQNTTFKFAKKIFLFSVWLCFSGSRFSEVRWFDLIDPRGTMRPHSYYPLEAEYLCHKLTKNI